jgi:hypothetical protein
MDILLQYSNITAQHINNIMVKESQHSKPYKNFVFYGKGISTFQTIQKPMAF